MAVQLASIVRKLERLTLSDTMKMPSMDAKSVMAKGITF